MSRYDPEAGVLEIAHARGPGGLGALDRAGAGRGCRVALFEQEVVVRKPLLRLLAVPGRPLFVANHALMMRAGLRGLRALLRRAFV